MPRLGLSLPARIFNAVDLPIPLVPTSPRTCPGRGTGSLGKDKIKQDLYIRQQSVLNYDEIPVKFKRVRTETVSGILVQITRQVYNRDGFEWTFLFTKSGSN